MLKGLKIVNLSDTAAAMYLYGQILDDRYKSWVTWDEEEDARGYVFPTDVKKELESLKGKTIDLYINSPGGHVNAGMAIANILARHDSKTVAHNDGEVASIAVMPYMACDIREMAINTTLMVHPPSVGFVSGNAYDLRKYAEALDTVEQSIINMLLEVKNDGVSDDDIISDVKDETWYTAEQAAAKYDITVVPAHAEAVAYAGDPMGMFKNMPDFVKNGQKLGENPFKNIKKQPKNDDSDTKKQRKIAIFNALNGI